MILVNSKKLQEGMILAEAIIRRGRILFPKGATLNENHIARIRIYDDITAVWTDNTTEQKKQIEKDSPSSVKAMQKLLFTPGQYVCLQGEKADCLYILISGELDVLYTDETLFTAEDGPLEKLPIIEKHGKKVSSVQGKMNSFGELGVLLGEKRSVTLMAAKESIVALIPTGKEGFSKTLINTPHLGMNIAITTVRRLKETYARIARHSELIAETEAALQEYSAIYMELSESISRKVMGTTDYNLCCVHDRLKLSPLYQNRRKNRKQEQEEDCISRKSGPEIESDDIFTYGQILERKAGTEILSRGENSSRMYVLIYGNVGIFREDKAIATYNTKGDLIGAVNALAAHATKRKQVEQRTITVKALSDTRLLMISAAEFDTLAEKSPALVLHITRIMAEKLKDSLLEYSESLKNAEEMINKLAGPENSCAGELKAVIDIFLKKPDSAYECSAELKVLNSLLELLQKKYSDLYARFF